MNSVELTKKLVAINSVNPFKTVEVAGRSVGIGNETNINEYLETLLKAKGFSTERQLVESAQSIEVDGQLLQIPQRWNLLAQKGEGSSSVLFFGHTDTVDVKPGWESDPFIATEKVVDGQKRLYGLGANDMKSGIAAVIAGIPEELPQGLKVKIALVVDEEYWSFGGATMVESSFLDDVVFAVSPEIGERGGDCTAQQIGLGRLGREEFLFKVVGRACHGADAFVDTSSINAVHESVKLQAEIIKYCEQVKKTFNEEGVSAINSAYINLQQGGRGMLSVPDTAEFILDRSLIPGEDPEVELTALRELVAGLQKEEKVHSGAKISVQRRERPTPSCHPFFVSKSDPKVKELSTLVKSLGFETEYFFGRSVADENRTANRGITTVILSPVGEASHTSREWVAVDSIERLEKVVTAICKSSFWSSV